MARRIDETGKRNARAIEIYKWCLDRPDPNDRFAARDANEDSKSLVNIQAMRLLIARGLIMPGNYLGGSRSYKLKKVVPIEGCLDIPTSEIDPNIKRYRVFPSVAREYATADNLQDYAIKQ